MPETILEAKSPGEPEPANLGRNSETARPLEPSHSPRTPGVRQWLYLAAGGAMLVAARIVHPPAGLSQAGLKTVAIMAATVLWWSTETLPVPVTALMIPVLVWAMGIMPFADAAQKGLGTTLVPFTIGVLALSAAFSASGLGKRMTFRLLTFTGTASRRVIAAFLWMSFGVSMFMDDLAVVALFLPLALGLLKTIDAKPRQSNFATGLVLAIVFGSTLGGIATPAGVSANIVTTAFLAKDAGIHVGFLYWTAIATPIAAVITAAAYCLIVSFFPPEMKDLRFGAEQLRAEVARLGPMTIPERTTLAAGIGAGSLWLASDWTGIPIAVVSLLILLAICMPTFGVFRSWRELSQRIEWGALLLLANGYVLGTAASQSGLAEWMVKSVLCRMAVLPVWLQPGLVVLLTAADSLGFASFGTTASVNVPFMLAYARQNGFPIVEMVLATGFASSVHFILVTQSPSIALPYSSGYFRVKDLAKLGIAVTLVAAVVITAGLDIASLIAR